MYIDGWKITQWTQRRRYGIRQKTRHAKLPTAGSLVNVGARVSSLWSLSVAELELEREWKLSEKRQKQYE